MYARLNRFTEAIDAYQRTLTLDPDHAEAMFNLSGAFLNCGDLKRAAQEWKAAIARFPDHELAIRIRMDFPRLL